MFFWQSLERHPQKRRRATGSGCCGVHDRRHVRERHGRLARNEVSIFSKRDPGEPATAQEWDTRALPAPQTPLAFAAIKDCQRFGERWCKRLGLADTSAVTLLDHLAPHEHHLNYAQRLAEARSIVSGRTDGACTNLIGRSLKANADRPHVRRVNRMAMAGLCSLMYGHQWAAYGEYPRNQ